MEELLMDCIGKRIDVSCSSPVVYRGVAAEIRSGLLVLKGDDGNPVYIAIDKISAVYECSDHISRPGFIA
ncbi:MAG: MM0924 family protein [Pyrinomonadaceae bacterium]